MENIIKRVLELEKIINFAKKEIAEIKIQTMPVQVVDLKKKVNSFLIDVKKITGIDVQERNRTPKYSTVRHICIYLTYNKCVNYVSLKDIANMYGLIDHSSVIYARNKIINDISVHDDITTTYLNIIEEIFNKHII